MKKLFPLNWMLGLCAVIIMVACGGGSDDPEPDPTPTPLPTPTEELNVTQTELNFSGDGGSSSFSVTGNTGWSIQSSADWCSVSPTSGTQAATVNVKVTANSDIHTRNCTLTIKSTSGKLMKEITVKQESHVFTLSVSTTVLNVAAESSTQKIAVEGDDLFEATSSELSWCNVNVVGYREEDNFKGIEVSISENTSNTARTATITITGKNTGKTFEVSVTQEGHAYTLSVNTTAMEVPVEGTTEKIAVEGDDLFEATSSEPSWCSVTTVAGTDDDFKGIEVSVDENDGSTVRTATITITGKYTGKVFNISVKQERKPDIDRTGYDPDRPL